MHLERNCIQPVHLLGVANMHLMNINFNMIFFLYTDRNISFRSLADRKFSLISCI